MNENTPQHRLKSARAEKGISQARLSELSGVPKRTIENIEMGTRNGSNPTWIKLAPHLDVSAAHLAGLDGDA